MSSELIGPRTSVRAASGVSALLAKDGDLAGLLTAIGVFLYWRRFEFRGDESSVRPAGREVA